jgi:two-component sensor histidine kinase
LPVEGTRSDTKIAAEADHRIANSLAVIASLVRLKAANGNPSVDRATFLREIAERIDTVARLHRYLAYSPSGLIRLNEYLREICESLSGALVDSKTSFTIKCAPAIAVPFDVALPLGLITTELLTNSFKYAHPSGLPVDIAVSCTRTDKGELTLVYEDDGVGFPESFNVEENGHLGMRLIRSLSQQLGATTDWQSDPLGVRFEITVPLRRGDAERRT